MWNDIVKGQHVCLIHDAARNHPWDRQFYKKKMYFNCNRFLLCSTTLYTIYIRRTMVGDREWRWHWIIKYAAISSAGCSYIKFNICDLFEHIYWIHTTTSRCLFYCIVGLQTITRGDCDRVNKPKQILTTLVICTRNTINDIYESLDV